MHGAPPFLRAVPVTVIRDHLTKQELCRLDGPVPLSPRTVIELTDGGVACVVAVRLTIDEPIAGQAQLIVEVSPG